MAAFMILLLTGCSEPSFEGIDLSPETVDSDIASVNDSIPEGTGPASSSSTSSTSTTAPPTTREPTTTTEPPNPADLGRTVEDGVFYVGPNGADTNDGRLPSQAYATLNHAIAQLAPGEQLLVLDGTYDEAYRSDTAVNITAKGEPGAWIEIAPFPGHQPIVRGAERNAFKFEGAEYVALSGLELIGSGTDRLGAGVHIETPSHHIRIQGNTVHGFPAGGINVTGSSHVLIASNEVFGNARFNPGQHSGISFWRPDNLGIPDDENGYSNYVVGNIVHDNRNTVPGNLGITDGNCIIIDQTRLSGYTGRTLIANNVCFNNGGRGINIHESERADVVNNTSFSNLKSGDLEGTNGELMTYESNDVRFINNLVATADGERAGYTSRSNDVIFVDNLFITDDAGVGGENTVVPPSELAAILVNPSLEGVSTDFSIVAGSIAVDLGRSDFTGIIQTDHLGNPRLAGGGVDVGAFELAGAG